MSSDPSLATALALASDLATTVVRLPSGATWTTRDGRSAGLSSMSNPPSGVAARSVIVSPPWARSHVGWVTVAAIVEIVPSTPTRRTT